MDTTLDTLLSSFLILLMGQKHTPDTTTDIKDAYDYVIVGAGSAGSVLAARLTEKECVTVLLLEAGKSPPKESDIPATSRLMVNTDIDWKYTTTPQVHTGAGLVNRSVFWPSGKAIGGSSVINAMLNLRGNRQDYDEWANELGAEGWDYESVLPYFKKLEDNRNQEYIALDPIEYHGVNGPVTVSKPGYVPPLKIAVMEAGQQMGYHVGDINGPMQSGFYDLQGTIREGQRCSSAKAYLVPNENRENLDIVANAFVKQIPVKADLPVGRNLQDHVAPILAFLLEVHPDFATKLVSGVDQYIFSKTGPLSTPEGCSILVFLDRDGRNGTDIRPEYELYFLEFLADTDIGAEPEYLKAIFGKYEGKAITHCIASLLHPKSRGTVTLRSADPYDPPVIDPNYFSDKDDDDMQVVVAALKKCKEIITSEPMKKINATLFDTVYPGCENDVNDDDQYFRCMTKAITITLNHQVGTATMGDPKDPNTVVDPKLRVKSIRKLRVVDASVMPRVPGGNTNVPTMMVAEKAADIIKEDIHCNSG